MNRIYLDHAATTPVRPEVVEAMLPHFTANGYNPSSLHAEGRRARAALDAARASVARSLGARPREIVFTGSGSEADNLAIVGAARARRERGRHVVTTAVEHHAVLHACGLLRDDGWEITELPVDSGGRVAPDAFAAALRPTTTLASIVMVNNELGTRNPIAELAAIARARDVTFHTDAVQATLVEIDAGALGVDLLSLSAHKFYGPKGVGVLYVRGPTPLVPIVAGGGQEGARRAGTENVAGIAGLARALELSVAERSGAAARIERLRERLERGLLAALPGAQVHAGAVPRAPHVASIALGAVDGQALLARLDLEGIAVSAGSACAAGAVEPSHVLVAIGAPDWARTGTVRFSLGRTTSEEEIESVIARVPKIVASVGEMVEQ
ncbi:MAG: cysteine desulfurase family protein [Vulcanimicrobiaceae bacterium]